MNEIEKQIEEMAKVIESTEFDWYVQEGTSLQDWVKMHSQALYNAGYRNCKDKVVLDKKEYEKLKSIEIILEEFAKADVVVLSKEEYESIQKLFTYDKPMLDRVDNFIKEIKEQARKETARDIIEMLVPPCEVCDENWHKGCLCLRATIAEKIANQYGVEVK